MPGKCYAIFGFVLLKSVLGQIGKILVVFTSSMDTNIYFRFKYKG